MGKVASDKCHKWVFKEPSECEPNVSNYWQSSFDAVSIKKSLKTLYFSWVFDETCYHCKLLGDSIKLER